MDAIRTEALTKHYRVGFWRPRPYVALEALTLHIRQGEVFGFLGPNGAGKTTTLKLLMPVDSIPRPDAPKSWGVRSATWRSGAASATWRRTRTSTTT